MAAHLRPREQATTTRNGGSDPTWHEPAAGKWSGLLGSALHAYREAGCQVECKLVDGPGEYHLGGGVTVRLSQFRRVERLDGPQHPAVYRVVWACRGCGQDHLGLVTHDELEPDSDMAKGIAAGWPMVLSSLKTLLESGAPLEMTTKRMTRPPA